MTIPTLAPLARSTNVALMAMLFASLTCLASTAHAAETEPEWSNLVEGEDLTKLWATTGNWVVQQDGVVKLTPRPGEHGWGRFDAYLWLKQPVENFEIEFEYLLQKGGNSGFYFRVADKKNPVHNGIEVQLYDTPSRGENPALNDHDAGGLIPFGVPPKANAAKPGGEWNKFHITVKDNKLTVLLNGKLVNEATLNESSFKTRAEKGYLGFQDHGLPLELRNIRLKTL